MVPILSGRFEGELEGTILAGGADWQVASDDGITYLEARYSIETLDGALILVHNRGIRHGSPEVLAQLFSGEVVDPARYYFRSAPSFEPSDERYAWLNMFGAVLAAQGKNPEAEKYLIHGYEGMVSRRPTTGSFFQPMLFVAESQPGERILQLYMDWGKPEKVAEWRSKVQGAPRFRLPSP
jgi:hypothetical protein